MLHMIDMDLASLQLVPRYIAYSLSIEMCASYAVCSILWNSLVMNAAQALTEMQKHKDSGSHNV